jgi:hypothetical protein
MVAQTFRGHGRIEYAEAGTPMALGYDEAGNALRNETRPELSVMAGSRGGDGPAAPHRQAIGKKASQRGLEQHLLLGQSEIHATSSRSRAPP